MSPTLCVLWILFSASWSFHGRPMTPGWASVAVLDEEACQTALLTLGQLGSRTAVCLPAGTPDEPRPLARARR